MVSCLVRKTGSWTDEFAGPVEVIGLVEVPTRINKGKGAMAQYIAVEVSFNTCRLVHY